MYLFHCNSADDLLLFVGAFAETGDAVAGGVVEVEGVAVDVNFGIPMRS